MIIFTKHAEEKLKRPDIKRFNINKKLIENILKDPQMKSKTKYGDLAASSQINDKHDLRIIYDIIDKEIKVITFHISKKGRYK
jgi:mRNA-degrading endonuclease RelE of RelBE toxin-antitoxin system